MTSAVEGTKLEEGPRCPLVFIQFVFNDTLKQRGFLAPCLETKRHKDSI